MNLQTHVNNDKAKWIVTFVLFLVIIGGVIGGGVYLNNQINPTYDLGHNSFEIGCITDEGKRLEGNTDMRTSNYIKVDGLKVTLAEDAEVTYTIFFFDEEKDFISKTEVLSADFDGTAVPKTAKYCMIEVTPTADEDGKITKSEVNDYLDGITVTLNK